MNPYPKRVRALLSPRERRLYARLRTPALIQDYLDALSVNFELGGETYRSPREVLKRREAHCMEAALLAASLLAYHGEAPLLLDLRALDAYEDHVVALFRRNGRWGALSKSNHAIMRSRDAVYTSPRELALSYFHEFVEDDGTKSLRSYSAPFDLRKFAPERWVTSGEDLGFLVDRLEASRHFPIASPQAMRALRPPSRLEVRAFSLTNERDPRRRKTYRRAKRGK